MKNMIENVEEQHFNKQYCVYVYMYVHVHVCTSLCTCMYMYID